MQKIISFEGISMKPNLGIKEESQKKVADMLNILLADEYVLYTKTYNYHWNVYGPHFSELHTAFEEQYRALFTIVDDVAERVRALGYPALGTLAEFLKSSRLGEAPGIVPHAQDMIRNLLHDHEAIIRSIRDDMHIIASEHNDLGTDSFLGALLEKHEKIAWMLRASIEM